MVLPFFYGLASTASLRTLSLPSGYFGAMDSGANTFMFPPEYVLPGSRAPSSHCLISATSGPARIPLHSAQVMFGIHDSLGVLQIFRQSAFVHADHPFVFKLFPLSTLAEHGCYIDFYGTGGLQCGSMFLPFTLTDGLYLVKVFTVPFDSLSMSFSGASHPGSVLVAQTRSVSSAVPVLVPVPSGALPVVFSESVLPASGLPPLVSVVPDPSDLFSSSLTGAGLLLLHAHRRLGHLHDRNLKRMIDCGMCGSLKWVPGIVIRARCWDCLKGQQKRNVPAPDPNLRELHPLSCQVLIWDWCGPHHVCGLNGELYWFLAVCPRGYHYGAVAVKKSEFIVILNCLLRHIRGKVGDDRVRFVKFDGGAEFVTESVLEVYRAWNLEA